MNEHIKNKHMGRRFICPVCSTDCTATSSLERHMKRFHQVKKEPNTSQIVLSQDALLAKIKNLEKTLEAKNKEIADLKEAVKKPLKKKGY